jgi:hypothetical protein
MAKGARTRDLRIGGGRSVEDLSGRRSGLSLLGISHTNPLPVVFALSAVIRNEVLDSVYREMATKIIIGGEVVAFNFPLNAGLRPCEPVDAARAEVPLSKELFIGIQVPSPRNAVDADAVRSNVEEVVELLSSMNHPLPPIRVSFTPTQTRAAASIGGTTLSSSLALSRTCVCRRAIQSSSPSTRSPSTALG